MTAVSPNLQDLRRRVLAGEDVPRDVMISAIAALREERSKKAQKTSKSNPTNSPIAKENFDLTTLFSKPSTPGESQ